MRDRIIVHLAPYSRYADEFECPEAMSQAGISQAIGKSRAHTTLELNRMKEADLVTERLAHVKGTRSKRKTYTLTNQALVTERQITGHVEGLEIEMLGSEAGIINGRQAVDFLISELPTSRALAFDIVLSSDGKIDPEENKQPPPSPPIPDDGEIVESVPEQVQIHDSRTFDALVLQANTFSKKGQPEEALAVLDKAMESKPSDLNLSRAHYSRASVFRKQGNYPSALEEINKSLKIAENLNNLLMVGRCQMEKAMILAGKGSETQSLELLDSADMIFRQENSQVDLLRCGINQGMILRNMGKVDEAIDVLEVSLDLAEKTSLDRLKAYAMVNTTDLLNEQGEYARSADMAQTAGDIFQVLDEPLMLAASLFNMGAAQAGLGKKEEAMTNLDNAISVLEKNGMLASRITWLEKYAAILDEMGESEKAKSILKKI